MTPKVQPAEQQAEAVSVPATIASEPASPSSKEAPASVELVQEPKAIPLPAKATSFWEGVEVKYGAIALGSLLGLALMVWLIRKIIASAKKGAILVAQKGEQFKQDLTEKTNQAREAATEKTSALAAELTAKTKEAAALANIKLQEGFSGAAEKSAPYLQTLKSDLADIKSKLVSEWGASDVNSKQKVLNIWAGFSSQQKTIVSFTIVVFIALIVSFSGGGSKDLDSAQKTPIKILEDLESSFLIKPQQNKKYVEYQNSIRSKQESNKAEWDKVFEEFKSQEAFDKNIENLIQLCEAPDKVLKCNYFIGLAHTFKARNPDISKTQSEAHLEQAIKYLEDSGKEGDAMAYLTLAQIFARYNYEIKDMPARKRDPLGRDGPPPFSDRNKALEYVKQAMNGGADVISAYSIAHNLYETQPRFMSFFPTAGAWYFAVAVPSAALKNYQSPDRYKRPNETEEQIKKNVDTLSEIVNRERSAFDSAIARAKQYPYILRIRCKNGSTTYDVLTCLTADSGVKTAIQVKSGKLDIAYSMLNRDMSAASDRVVLNNNGPIHVWLSDKYSASGVLARDRGFRLDIAVIDAMTGERLHDDGVSEPNGGFSIKN